MKKKLVRMMALALTLLMCLSLVPVSALAMDMDPAAIMASAQAAYAAQAVAVGGGMYLPSAEPAALPVMDPTLDPNVCLKSPDGGHLWIEVYKPEYLCEPGDCNEENPHILYKCCEYCLQSAQWLYEAAMEEVNNERLAMGEAAFDLTQEEIEALEYRYKQYIFEVPDHLNEKKSAQAPTCTEAGFTAYEHCLVCDELTGYEEIAALGHDWGEYEKVTDPTCTVEGSQKRACRRCVAEETAPIPALGHDWGEFVVTKEPTCTETGTTRRDCERCRDVEEGVIPAKGHTWGEFTNIKEATCTDDGSKDHTCEVCKVTETVVIPAAHTWGDFTVTKEATCAEAGEKVHTCTVCGDTEPVAIPATGEHSYGEDNICTVCGAEKPAAEEPAVEEPAAEEPVTEAGESIGANVELTHGDMYASFGAYLDEQGKADAKYVVANYTPVDADGHALDVIPEGGVTFDLPLPEGCDAESAKIYTYDFSTHAWSPAANFTRTGDKLTVSSGAYPFPPFAVQASAKNDDAELGEEENEALKNASGRITNVRIYAGDTSVIEAKVGTELTVKCDSEALNLKYQWYRITSDGGEPTMLGTGKTYTLTDADCPYHVNCSVCEEGSENDAESAPNSVHVRKDVPFPISVRGLGTIRTTNLDKPNAESSAVENKEYTHTALGDFVEANPPFPIGAMTENEVTITVEPASGYVVRYVREDNTIRVHASKDAKTYTIESVNKGQQNSRFWVYFDQYYVKVDPNDAIKLADKENKETVRQGFLDAYVKNEEPYAYYYVTPCWKGTPATYISDTDLPTFGGFTFPLVMPEGVTEDNYGDYDVHVYHYVKDTAKWESVPFEAKTTLVDGENKFVAEIQNFSRFSPFGIVAIPSVKMEFAPGDHAALKDAAKPMPPLTTVSGGSVTVPQPDLAYFTVENGYTFDSWKGSDDKTYNPGDDVTLTADMTLTAQWKSGYTITFDDNDSNNPDTYGALVTGTMDPIYVSKGDEVTISSKFSLKNHRLRGWSKTSGPNNTPDPTYDSAFTPDGDLKLYASWERTHVTVSYNGNGGSGAMTEQQAPVGSGVPVKSNGFTAPNANLMFGGWSETADGNPVHFPGDVLDADTDITLYAVWREKVDIHFNPKSDSGTGGGAAYFQTVPSGVKTPLLANKFTPPTAEQAFAGWNDRPDGTGNGYMDQEVTAWTGETWLYAQWGPAITVTYVKNSPDATGTMADQKVAANEDFKLSALAFSNPAYEFMGWAKTAGGTPVYDDAQEIEGGFPDDTTLYAIWDKKGFTGTVKLSGNVSGSSGTAFVDEILTATVTGETVFTEFEYTWKRDDGTILTSVEDHPDQYIPTTEDFGHNITCEVTATEATKNPKTKTSAPKEVGIETTTKRIVNNGQTESDYVFGLTDDMTYSVNNSAKQPVPAGGVMEVTQQGTYRFYKGDALVGIVEVENWFTVGYVNDTSSNTGTANTSGSGTITAKATLDGTERTLTASTTIKDSVTGETVLQPYVSVAGYDHVWIVRQGSGVGFYLTVRPASGSYGHVSVNNGSYDSSSAERTYRVDPVNTYAMYSIIFNRSSSSPRTGDDSRLGLWTALCFMSLAGAGVLLNGERKRRKAHR